MFDINKLIFEIINMIKLLLTKILKIFLKCFKNSFTAVKFCDLEFPYTKAMQKKFSGSQIIDLKNMDR